MMKIAIIRTGYGKLNTKTYNIQEIGLAKALIPLGVSTDIYSRFADLNEPIMFCSDSKNNVRLIPLKGITLFGKLTYFRGLIPQIKKANYNVVQVHEDSQLMTPIILKSCNRLGITTVLYQGMYKNYNGIAQLLQLFWDFFVKRIIQKNSSLILAKTPLAKEYLRQKGYSRINILPIGLDIKKYSQPYEDKENLLHFANRHEKNLLYIGKIEQRRNPFFLIDLMFSLRTHDKLNVGLIIVGNGPLAEEMRKYSLNKSVIEHCLFIDAVNNDKVHEFFQHSDIFLLPTNNEIYGMVIMEALYYGIPVLSTPEAGPLSILTDPILGGCYFLHISKWVAAVKYYFSHYNKKEDREFRKNNVEFKFDWGLISAQYCAFLGLNNN